MADTTATRFASIGGGNIEFNRENLRLLREDVNTALQAVATKHGISIKVGNITYLTNNCTMKVEAANIENGVVLNKATDNFKFFCYRFGLKPEDLGRTFTYCGQQYTISGISPKSYKRPILATYNGKSYKFPADAVKMFLAKA